MTKQQTNAPILPPGLLPDLSAVQSKLNAGLSKAQDLTDRVMAYGRGNVDAVLQGSRLWADETRKVVDRAVSTAQTAAKQTVETGKALAAARSTEAFVSAQATGARTALDLVSAETKALTDIAATLTQQTLTTIGDRAGAAREIFARAA